jgi:2-dehydropantoate 2-reductase
MQPERIAIVGAGAVGCYFGAMLARAGVPVTLIGRATHVEAIRRDGLFIERSEFQEYVRLDADVAVSAVAGAGIVLLCVKTVDTETAAAALAPHLDQKALLVSLQNGVDNVERIGRATGIAAIPAVIYVAAAMSGPGRVKHSGRGDLIIGRLSPGIPSRENLQRVARVFESARILCRISDNIAAELWTKLVMNCAYNAISAVTQARYFAIGGEPLVRQVIEELVQEVVAVASADGIALPDGKELAAAAFRLGDAMPQATSSTAQDLARGRPTEIDSLNGFVCRRGKELGIPTPVNGTLYALVKLLENSTRTSPAARI